MEEVTKWLKVLAFLQVHAVKDTIGEKPEVVLYKAGLKPNEIAELLDKKVDTVRKSINRTLDTKKGDVKDE